MVKDFYLIEARAGEVLKRSSHPNIATYFGCQVQGNRIIGFYIYVIYYECCNRLIQKPHPLDVDKYIEDIRKGIEHIHMVIAIMIYVRSISC